MLAEDRGPLHWRYDAKGARVTSLRGNYCFRQGTARQGTAERPACPEHLGDPVGSRAEPCHKRRKINMALATKVLPLELPHRLGYRG
jgi:hypothetical protein